MTPTRASCLAVATLGAMIALASPVHAQSPADKYPEHVVRIIVPFVAGGPTDVQVRWAAQKLSESLGQPFIIENRASAGGVPGTQAVARAAPDGYTLLGANPGPLTVGPSLRSTGYTLKDIAPIILIAKTPSCLVAKSSLGPKTFAEFVALAKKEPGKISYASPGIGTVGHLTLEYIARRAGIKLNHVPYRGAAPMANDVIAGVVDSSLMQVGTCAPMAKEGKVVALGVTSPTRAALLPDVPTFAEQGMPGFDTQNWNGLAAPAGTPPAILRKIADVITKELKTTEARDWLATQGYTPAGDALGAYGAFLEAETKRWAAVIKSSNIKEEAP
jgi:tripartite-type tricarboxylate transporter receptor subunit TctC